MSNDYMLEQKLMKDNPQLHRLFKESVFSIQNMLLKYKIIFPEYTDHTALHSLEVIDFCNNLIGIKNIDRLNADEIYILLMSAYLHDSGMGIRMKDYEEFSKNIDYGDYFNNHSRDNVPEIIRDFHNEYSGEYIKKYAALFDIPTKEHIYCIVQVSRGHRKTNLYDESQYQAHYRLANGNSVSLPYLAALIRLADELDIAADRNLQFMYDISNINDKYSIMEFKKHMAIKSLEFTEEHFIMHVSATDEKVYGAVLELKDKLKKTLDECRDVVHKRTEYEITQKDIMCVSYKPCQTET